MEGLRDASSPVRLFGAGERFHRAPRPDRDQPRGRARAGRERKPKTARILRRALKKTSITGKGAINKRQSGRPERLTRRRAGPEDPRAAQTKVDGSIEGSRPAGEPVTVFGNRAVVILREYKQLQEGLYRCSGTARRAGRRVQRVPGAVRAVIVVPARWRRTGSHTGERVPIQHRRVAFRPRENLHAQAPSQLSTRNVDAGTPIQVNKPEPGRIPERQTGAPPKSPRPPVTK